MEGYGAWRAHADSILSGELKPRGLDINYALSSEKDGASGGGLGWRGWTRILTFVGAATCGTFAVMKQMKVTKHADRYNDISKTKDDIKSKTEYENWYRKNYDDLKSNLDAVNENKKSRDIFGAAAGGFVFVGILTFVF